MKISDKQKFRVKSLLPQTASHYYQMRKGLILTPPKKPQSPIKNKIN